MSRVLNEPHIPASGGRIPALPYWLKDRGDRDEWSELEQRKLFVAMTRARDRLALVAILPLADRLERARDRCDEWDWTK